MFGKGSSGWDGLEIVSLISQDSSSSLMPHLSVAEQLDICATVVKRIMNVSCKIVTTFYQVPGFRCGVSIAHRIGFSRGM
jgi:hypothetical protein